ncbi:ATP-dependent endonuclease [Salmonella enterica]|nr:ATP-dependent endonuclease [Salmonella enterica]ECE0740259.1 ATP-dependent endonuclease [Salmonella enterica subsp. enterica serovar Hvittingfoss]EGA8118233.1 AAA family ATPase [Salmonella enterica]EHO8673512.1 AAA family ATPase [Salmonella enterica]
MKLSSFFVENFKCIGSEIHIKIDKIIILIGQNNVGKSTILDAYEKFSALGKEKILDISHFHNEDASRPVIMTGIFTDISDDDEKIIGKKWKYCDPVYGECVKFRWVWNVPGEPAIKEVFDPAIGQGEFVVGGLGGLDSLVSSRIPKPLRIKPDDSVLKTQELIIEILKSHVKELLSSGPDSKANVIAQIEALTDTLVESSKAEFERLLGRMTDNIEAIFPGICMELIPQSKDPIDEKIIASASYLKVRNPAGRSTMLDLQGTGLKRSILWSALSVLSQEGKSKKGDVVRDYNILLIDEPEAFLHPPTIRGVREALYAFAANNPDWQVMATTHSPVFIDLSKDHTTIIRVDNDSQNKYISTSDVGFDNNEKNNIKIVRACNPMVNEFFFYNKIVLVEGATEKIVLNHIQEKLGLEMHVIDCLGKGNIPIFVKILNQFDVPYLVIHDSDSPNIRRKGKCVKNGMWTLNGLIRDEVAKSQKGRVFTQVPHFEGEFFGETLTSGKVSNVIEILQDDNSEEYSHLISVYRRILNNEDDSLFTGTHEAFMAKLNAYTGDKTTLTDPELWEFSIS